MINGLSEVLTLNPREEFQGIASMIPLSAWLLLGRQGQHLAALSAMNEKLPVEFSRFVIATLELTADQPVTVFALPPSHTGNDMWRHAPLKKSEFAP